MSDTKNSLVRWRLRFGALLALSAALLSSPELLAQGVGPTTTFFVVRHAERSTTGGVGLSKAGKERAQQLKNVLVPLRVAAVYSTNTVRTQETAKPTATAVKKEIHIYSALSSAQFKSWKSAHSGGSVLIVGHSGTVDDIVKGLGTTGDFKVSGREFDNLIVVSVRPTGSTAIRLRYGDP